MTAPATVGSEILVNTTTAGQQLDAMITMLTDGRFVVAWEDLSSGTSDIRAQVFNPDGTHSGTEILVNATTAGTQGAPTVTALASGAFLIAWQDQGQTGGDTSGSAVRARMFASDGSAGGEFLVNTTTAAGQFAPTVATLADGRVVVAWADDSAGTTDIRAQAFNPDGTPSGAELLLNATTAGSQARPAITTLADGRYVVAWEDTSGGSSEIRARIFAADGTPFGAEISVNTTTTGVQDFPAIAGLAGGGFVVAWTDNSHTGDDTSLAAVRAQIFAADGSPVGAEFLVNATTSSSQSGATIAVLDDGRFVIAFTDQSETGGDVSSHAVRAQVFNPDGTRSGDEFLVNTTTAAAQNGAAVAALTNYQFAVAWTDFSQTGADTSATAVRAQIFAGANGPNPLLDLDIAGLTDGNPVEDQELIWNATFDRGTEPATTFVTYGEWQVFRDGQWQVVQVVSSVSGGTYTPVEADVGHPLRLYVVYIDAEGNTEFGLVPLGTVQAANEAPTSITLDGSSVVENAADGTLIGILSATDPDSGDTATFSLVDDAGGRFAVDGDQLVVANGELLDFEAATSHDVIVRVTDNDGLTLDATFTITLEDVVGLTISGTNKADILVGTGDDDTISGANGDDALTGGAGKDTLNGGNGDDAIDGGAGADTINGGNGDDVIDSGSGDNSLTGGNGDDSLVAGSGNDDLTGGNGDDMLDAGAGHDTLAGNNGHDTLTGGDGNDLINGGNGDDLLDPGSGNDQAHGDQGNDLLIYVMSENAGATDSYDGGRGTDTLRLVLTQSQFESAAVQADIAAYQVFLTQNSRPGQSNGPIFQFTAFDLAARNFEQLDIVISNATPADIALSNDSVDENSPNGTVVGQLSASDPDAGETFTFELVDDAGGRFAINGTDLVVAGALDFEAATSHEITIRVTDSADNTYEETFTIDVNNVSGLIVGDNTNNLLIGTSEEDTIQGLRGNDRLVGNAGPDLLDGGAGGDTADYQDSPIGLTADLAVPADNTGEAAGDVYIAIERLRGSAFDDILRGDDNTNLLDGGPGADVLDGRGGGDFTWYNSSPVGVMASLANPAINTGDAAGDTYISIERLAGSNFDDVLIGNNANNVLRGQAGADHLDGLGGADTADYFNSVIGLTADLATPANNTGDAAGDSYAGIENLRGGAFDDLLSGNSGANFLDGAGGADVLHGWGGNDFAWYDSATAGVTASLANPAINTGDAFGDTYISIEYLAGSNFDDTLIGDGTSNFLRGQAGADVLDGGAGPDWADYFNATVGLTADLATPANNTGDALGDTYISMENVRGTNFDDSLRGDGGNNFLRGGLGADVLNGRAGLDTADYFGATAPLMADLAAPANNTGEAVGDTYLNIENLRGSDFADTLRGNAGGNFLDGAGGADVLDGGGAIDQAWYNSSDVGVTASLANPAINTGDAAGDTYVSIEGLFGSRFSDILIGDGANNFFVGSGGGDAYVGDAGFDSVGYGGAGPGLIADLANPAGNAGQATGDTYDSIEGLGGSPFDDILRGDGNNNLLIGAAGADALDGAGGIDTGRIRRRRCRGHRRPVQSGQ
jgi:Ca2+-binding RTX toxin-like protein